MGIRIAWEPKNGGYHVMNSAAERRGHKISGDHLTICGTRFYLVAPSG